MPRSISTPSSLDTVIGSGLYGNSSQQQPQQQENGSGNHLSHGHSHSHSYTSSHSSISSNSGSASSGASPQTSPSFTAHRVTTATRGGGGYSGSANSSGPTAGAPNGGEHAWLSKGGREKADDGSMHSLHRTRSGGASGKEADLSMLDYYDAAVVASQREESSNNANSTRNARRPGFSEAGGTRSNGAVAQASPYDSFSRGGSGYHDDHSSASGPVRRPPGRVVSAGSNRSSGRSNSSGSVGMGYVGSTPVGAASSSHDPQSRTVSSPGRHQQQQQQGRSYPHQSSSSSSTSSKSSSPSSMNFELPAVGGNAASAGSSAMLEAAARLSQSRRQ